MVPKTLGLSDDSSVSSKLGFILDLSRQRGTSSVRGALKINVAQNIFELKPHKLDKLLAELPWINGILIHDSHP